MSHNNKKFSSLSSPPSSKSVPFSWEEEPGISKLGSLKTPAREEKKAIDQLPPPPFRSESPKVSAHGLHVPLPPCAFQLPAKSAAGGDQHKRGVGLRREEDPFLAAYLECTKSVKESKGRRRRGGGLGLSCKHGGGVMEAAIVSSSHFRILRSRDF